MYREPLIAFAVKRVKDTGTYGSAFEDGTKFTNWSLMRDCYTDKPDDSVDNRGLARLQLYKAYVNKVDHITLNDEDYEDHQPALKQAGINYYSTHYYTYMKKNVFNICLLAALLCGLSLSVTSCKDDDNGTSEEQGGNEEAPQQDEASVRFWSVVSHLVSADDYTKDYEDKTFEPTIGAEDTNPQYRVVYTNDAVTAAQRFSYLVGETDVVTEQTTTYTWNDPDVGTLTYNKVTDGTAWATVDVSIKQVPHLQRIVYRAPSQGDSNGGVTGDGSAYYRFGDVISRTQEDSRTEYWICVRPAFDPEGKGDTHWMSVSPVPTANQKTYTSSHKKNYVLPTGINYEEEHMQNLAELLFAIYNPKQWYDNVVFYNPEGMKMFHDFQLNNLAYHNQYFWQNVQKAWKNLKIAQTVFGYSDDALSKMVTDSEQGLYLLYKGYSWLFSVSNYCTLFQAHFVNSPGGRYANMQTKNPYTKVTKQVVDKKVEDGSSDIVIDISECSLNKPYYINKDFFGDSQPRFIVRYATGKQLSNTNKYTNNQESIPGCYDVYRYYKHVFPEKNLTDKPEKTGENDSNTASNAPAEGEAGTYMIGDVVQDDLGCKWFCINGSAYSKNLYPNVTDKSAWFITFDNVNFNEYKATDITTEEDLPEVSLRLMEFYETLLTANPPYKLNLTRDTLGFIARHILTYADVDVRKLVTKVDSTWKFYSNTVMKDISSKSTSYVSSIAYEDNTNQQAIARFVIDHTQSGDERTACVAKSGANFQYSRYLVYKNYEKYDSSKIVLTDDEASLKMNKWQALWPVSDTKMHLQDVEDRNMVSQFANHNKWIPEWQQRVMTGSSTPRYYGWNSETHSFATNNTSLLMDKVLFFRVMKVTDNGGKTPNLTSQEGRKLTVVHMQNDKTLYKQGFQASFASNYTAHRSEFYYINNKKYTVKPIPGME